ncbi:MAG TPA: helix-hairpin-helix domain-containing protein [Puia sp.]
MWETIRGYLTFTRKERFGVLFLLVLICILFVLPYLFRPSIGQPDPAAYEKMKEGIRKFESRETDSSNKAIKYDRYPDHKNDLADGFAGNPTSALRAELFYFDPNSLHANDCHRLGLPDRLTKTILHYIEKGGRFRKAEDLKKLYGLHNSDYERLFPFVRIGKSPQDFQARSGYYAKTSYTIQTLRKADSSFHESPLRMNPGVGFAYTGKKFVITDINLADSADWSRLPGIGEKLASRIVHFRERLGGFYQVDQVGETFGLPDSSFQKIKPFLRLNTISLNQIDLNKATKEILQSHPYIRWQIARGIIDYRQQHGGFQSVEELLQLVQMDAVKFEKLKPYLVANH